jgi:hypothetical protein
MVMITENNLFGFEISELVYTKLDNLLQNSKKVADKKSLAMDIYAVVEELSMAGLHYFFIAPLREANIGGLKIKTVEIAMNMGKNAVLSIGKGILKSMSNEQLQVVIQMLEKSLVIRSKSTNL